MIENVNNREEGEFFRQQFLDIEKTIQTMPKTYEQDGMGDNAVAHLHYFMGGYDWYITEKDMDGGTPQAFGLAKIHTAEIGYISIDELVKNGAELDLYWEPKTLAKIRQRLNTDT